MSERTEHVADVREYSATEARRIATAWNATHGLEPADTPDVVSALPDLTHDRETDEDAAAWNPTDQRDDVAERSPTGLRSSTPDPVPPDAA